MNERAGCVNQFQASVCARIGKFTLTATLAVLIQVTSARASDSPASSGTSELKTSEVDRTFADYALDSHIPGRVYGIVADGRLVYVRGRSANAIQPRP